MPDTLVCSEMDQVDPEHPYADTYDCPGDAGGFLVTPAKQGSRFVQVGIDSWTACYARPRGVGVYTRVKGISSCNAI